MRKWISLLFYIICFLAMAGVIYQLAFVIPPRPSDDGYLAFCLKVGFIAVVFAGMTVGFAALAIHFCDGYDRGEDGEKK